MNRKLILAPFLLLLVVVAQAQFSDSVTHFGRFSAAGNLNRTNSTTAYLLTNDARFSIKKKHTTINTAANWLYGEQGSRLTNNDFSTTADLNLYPDSARHYFWALGNYTSSYSLRIDNQLQAGVGAAYNFFNNNAAWLNLSEGLLFETSRLDKGAGVKDSYQTLRNSLRLSYRFNVNKVITLNGSNYWQPALGQENDYIIRTSNSVAFKLSSWLSFTTSVNYNQFKRTNKENFLLTYGLVAEKYF